jgi:prevent-host-death family protein
MSEAVGVRELRQNLSKYLDRVKAGESLTVTERGREVARLVPSGESRVQRLLREKYRASPARGNLAETIRRLPRLGPSPAGTTDELLAEQRREELL